MTNHHRKKQVGERGRKDNEVHRTESSGKWLKVADAALPDDGAKERVAAHRDDEEEEEEAVARKAQTNVFWVRWRRSGKSSGAAV